MRFLECAEAQGLPVKTFYSLSECAKVTGIGYKTLLRETKEGRLKCKTLTENRPGRMVKPEWMDEWSEA